MSPVPAPGGSLPSGAAVLAALLARRRPLLLMCDYDGTLVPIRPTPDAARPTPSLLRLLRQVAHAPGVALAVVSGRDLTDLQRLLPLRECCLVGGHGAAMRLPDGTVHISPAAVRAAPALAAIAAAARRLVAGKPGLLVEEKCGAVALHYRLAEPAVAAAALGAFRAAVAPRLASQGLVMTAGKMVVEVRPREVHKGQAVQWLRHWRPGCFPVFFGDDTTDEDAFQAVAAHGLGVLVGAPHATAARWRVASPQQVTALLAKLRGQA